MKISQMLLREDFYTINRETLNQLRDDSRIETELYIYPKLNAIVTDRPSLDIKRYLLCEYNVRTNILKRLIAKTYVLLCLNSRGKMAAKKMSIPATVSNDTLIYPCNRKYRIFRFDQNTVEVIVKAGFPADAFNHELDFRKNKNLPEFVPDLISFSSIGYTEKIIDGKPLARVESSYDKLKDQAFQMLLVYRESQTTKNNTDDYIAELRKKIKALGKKCYTTQLDFCIENLIKRIHIPTIFLTFSHGDLQSGNIWVENVTNHIFIIDWESWGVRSIWYDKAVLYDGLRPEGLSKYFEKNIEPNERAVVLLEDLVFQLMELNNLPANCGEKQFTQYLNTLQEQLLKEE